MKSLPKVVVREYKDDNQFVRDAERLAKDGYEPINIIRTKGHIGTRSPSLNVALAVFTGGLGLLATHTHATLKVTYSRLESNDGRTHNQRS